jgi:hypothetical protein
MPDISNIVRKKLKHAWVTVMVPEQTVLVEVSMHAYKRTI